MAEPPGFWRRRFGHRSPDAILADVDVRVLSLADAARWLGWRPLEVLGEARRDRRPRRLGRWWVGQRVFTVDPSWRPRRPPEPLILTRIRDRALMRKIVQRRNGETMTRSRPSRAAVEHRIRLACDDLIAAGVLAVGWPRLDEDDSGVLDLCVEVEGIDLDEAGRLLSRTACCVVAPCRQTADFVATNGSVVKDGDWIYRTRRNA